MYLADEREKYGNHGLRDHFVAAAQTLVGFKVAIEGGAVGSLLCGELPIIGTLACGIVGAVCASISYNEVDIGGKSQSERVGDGARITYNEAENFIYKNFIYKKNK